MSATADVLILTILYVFECSVPCTLLIVHLQHNNATGFLEVLIKVVRVSHQDYAFVMRKERIADASLERIWIHSTGDMLEPAKRFHELGLRDGPPPVVGSTTPTKIRYPSATELGDVIVTCPEH